MKLNDVRALKMRLLAEGSSSVVGYSMAAGDVGCCHARGPAGFKPMSLMAVGVGFKDSDYSLAVRLGNSELLDLPLIAEIQREAAGEVDIRVVGQVSALGLPWYQRMRRPLKVGLSVGHYKATAGTLGAFVRFRSDRLVHPKVMILSNNHVLADANIGQYHDAILQPGPGDLGCRVDHLVAHLEAYPELAFGAVNEVDVAVATLADGIDFDLMPFSGTAAPDRLSEPDLLVTKTGRTTGTTWGRVSAAEMSGIEVNYGNRIAVFKNQIEIESASHAPFSRAGDSGSLVTTPDGEAIGLLFAGTALGGANGCGLTYANPIDRVLETLEIELFIG